MKAMKAVSKASAHGSAPALEEEFLLLVDRAMLAHKQSDPYRLEQVNRAVAEEVQLAKLTGSHHSSSKHRGDPSRF